MKAFHSKFKIANGFIFSCLILFLVSTQSITYAQGQKNNGTSISGILIDSANNSPIPFANVAVFEIATNSLIAGTTTLSDGTFTIKNLAPASYKIICSFIGYRNKEIEKQVLENSENTLGVIHLHQELTALNEVVVTSQKQGVEQKVDRFVYNPDDNISNSGGDATDVLKNVPMLSVDMNGNLYLKGSQNIKLLINNKPSSLAVTSMADALRQIPAELIKSIEVITSPPSKYDAEGSSGIVNIVLKKSTELSTLTSNGSFEVRTSKVGLNGSLKRGKMTYSGNVAINYSYNHPGHFSNTQTTTDINNNTSTIYQHTNTNFNSFRQTYSFNWDYDIDQRNYITSSVVYFTKNDHSYQNDLHSWDDTSDLSLKDVKNFGGANSLDANLTYSHQFAKPKRELTVMGLYSHGGNSNNFITTSFNTADFTPQTFLKNLNDYSNGEMTIQADFQTPLLDNLIMEMGAKNILRTASSEYQYLKAESDQNFEVHPIPTLTNSLHYSQNVSAAYQSFHYTLAKKYELKAGLRYEVTTIEAKFADTEKINIPSYSVLVPSFNFAKTLTSGKVFKLSYNRRIQRPSIQYLNPNLQSANPLNVVIGNPKLRPEFTDNFDASYSTNLGSVLLDLAGFLKTTHNAIQSVKSILGSDTVSTTYKNTGRLNVFGMNVNGSVNLSSKLSFSANINSFYSILKGDDPIQNKVIRNEGLSNSIQFSGKYKISNTIRSELIVLHQPNSFVLQGGQHGWTIFNVSIKKDLAEKRGSFGFTAGNFITGSVKFRNEFDSPYLHQKTTSEIRNLNFKVFFTYQLIKPKKQDAVKSRKSITNDDLKASDGN